MRQHFGTFVLILYALFGLLTASVAAVRPTHFAQSLGLSIANSGGINEVRAQYAGCFSAIAILCVLAFFGAVPRPWAFVVLVVVFAGLISGRLISLALNAGTSGYPPAILALYAIDSLGLILSFTALRLNPV